MISARDQESLLQLLEIGQRAYSAVLRLQDRCADWMRTPLQVAGVVTAIVAVVGWSMVCLTLALILVWIPWFLAAWLVSATSYQVTVLGNSPRGDRLSRARV